MKANVFRGLGPFGIEEVPRPRPGDGRIGDAVVALAQGPIGSRAFVGAESIETSLAL